MPRKRRSNLGQTSNDAKRKRLSRAVENEEERRKRLEAERIRASMNRAAEDINERRWRLETEQFPNMTEVMSDVNSSSNSKFEKHDGVDADGVKLNGVADGSSTYEDSTLADGDTSPEQSLKNGCINRKHVRDTTTTAPTAIATKNVDHLMLDQTLTTSTTAASDHLPTTDKTDYHCDSVPQNEEHDCELLPSSVSNPVRIVSMNAVADVSTVTNTTTTNSCIDDIVTTISTTFHSSERIRNEEIDKLTNGCLPRDPLVVCGDEDSYDDTGGTDGHCDDDIEDDAGESIGDNDDDDDEGTGDEAFLSNDNEEASSSINALKTECSRLDGDAIVETKVSSNKLETMSNDDNKEEDLIALGSTPEKFKKSRKPSLSAVNVTPRRSSRNLNKQKSYAEKESAECENEDSNNVTGLTQLRKRVNEDDDIEEVTPTDPLADEPKTKIRNKTIVVSDTKGLVEFASNARASRTNKKEPTLVIIDTKSILSGRGPVPVSQSSTNATLLHSSSGGTNNNNNNGLGGGTGSSAPIPVSLPISAGALTNATRGLPASTSAFSVIPIGLPAQGMYSQYRNPPPQIKPIVVGPASTTVTPITIQSTSSLAAAAASVPSAATKQQQQLQSQQYHHQQQLQLQQQHQQSQQQPPVILPSLTDDMFVVEAPSFIVPYVYEKPPMKALKGHLEQIEVELIKMLKKEQEEREEREKQERELRERKEEFEKATCKMEKVDGEIMPSSCAVISVGNEVSAVEKSENESVAVIEDDVANEQLRETVDATADLSLSKGKQHVAEIDEKQKSMMTSSQKESSLPPEVGLHMEVDEEVDSSVTAVTTDGSTDNTDIILTCSKKSTAPESSLDSEKKEDIRVDGVTDMNKDRLENRKNEVASTTQLPLTDTTITPVKDDNKKSVTTTPDDSKKPTQPPPPLTYFDNPLGKFFMQIGLNLVQEHVQTDLLRSQKRKRDKEGENCSPEVRAAIEELSKTLESSKENNDPFKLDLKKCELCSFKTESLLVMAHHLETPHMKNYTYRCNFCPLEVRSPHDILFHMEAEHNIRGRLERAPAFHQCPNCPFEDNQKGKLTRHMVSCSKKYRPERNQEPPLDWEPPAKIPRVTRNRPPSMSPGNAVYQAAMSGLKQVPQNSLLPKLIPNPTSNMKQNLMNPANKRPNTVGAAAAAAASAAFVNRFPNAATNQSNFQPRSISVPGAAQGVLYRGGATSNSQSSVMLPQNYQMSNSQLYQNQNMKQTQQQQGIATAKLLNQPSISITPLPRQSSNSAASMSSNAMISSMKSGKQLTTNAGNKSSFVVCEICDGYIKDLEQLRNHMQWIHKVKIHPKMIYNRPPLNCQKCQYRFFTDQGLERHLLGSHGLVTSSMQEAANKGKDGGRCPVCGRVYQWKLLNHVARDHQMSLKPAHLSYKCTVCTATFGMYKQFESHVYSAHSVVAKRAMDAKKPPCPPASSMSSAAMIQSALLSSSSVTGAAAAVAQNDASSMRALRINDEITIIPQPVRSARQTTRTINSNASAVATAVSGGGKGKHGRDEYCGNMCVAEQFPSAEAFEQHLLSKHVKPFKIKISRIASKSMVNAFDKENTLVVSKEDDLDMEFLRHKYNLRDLYVCLINYRSLRTDYVYKVVFNDSQNSSINGNDTVSNENDDSRCNKYVDIDLVQLFAPSVTMRVGSQPLRRHENDGDHIVEEGISQTIERAGTSTGRIWSNILHFQRRRKPNRTTVSDAKHDLLNTFLKSGHFLSSSSLPVVPMPLPLSKSASVLSSTSSLISDLPCCDSASQHSITRISTLAAPASIAAATLSTFTSSNTKLSHRLHMSPVPIIVSELPFNKKNAQQRTCDNSIVTPAQYTITRTTMPYRPAAPSIPPSRAGSMFREHSFRPRSVVVWPPTACLTSNLSSLTNFRSCILPKNVQKTTVTCSTSTSVLTATKSTVLSASVASINTNHSKIGSNGVISLLSDTDSNASDDDVQLIDAENDNGVLSNNNNNNECVPLV